MQILSSSFLRMEQMQIFLVRIILISRRPSDPALDEHGKEALCTACEDGLTEVVRLLLERGADPNVHGECIVKFQGSQLTLSC
jgi:ankyrin repeat protein